MRSAVARSWVFLQICYIAPINCVDGSTCNCNGKVCIGISRKLQVNGELYKGAPEGASLAYNYLPTMTSNNICLGGLGVLPQENFENSLSKRCTLGYFLKKKEVASLENIVHNYVRLPT